MLSSNKIIIALTFQRGPSIAVFKGGVADEEQRDVKRTHTVAVGTIAGRCWAQAKVIMEATEEYG